MSKEINLDSKEWCDIVFEDKNKAYGAYKMRLTSSNRHLWAFVIVFLFAVLVAFLPTIISSVQGAISAARGGADNLTESSVLANLDTPIEDQVPEENIVRQPEAPPPPPLKSTIQFTAPVMVKAEEIGDDEGLSQDKLADAKEQISVATVKGTDDVHGIDIADLQEHKVIAEEKKEEIFYGVEQSPVYPGGEEEMFRYISNNLRYPPIAAENGIEGRVTIRFVIDKNGKVGNVEVLRGFDTACDREAVRVISSMPNWQPGRQNGRAVNVYFTIPVVFKLQKQ